MEASILPGPGTLNGPCWSCEHSDCRETRRMAFTVCPFCKEIIGYETRFYEVDEYGLVHAVCAVCFENAVEQEVRGG